MFSKSKMFTFRTLFWWGHDLIFSLILKQENLTPLIENLINLKEDNEWKDIQLAIAPTPWEWERDINNFITLSELSEIKIKNSIDTIQYIKLCRFYPLASPDFPKLNWTNTGIANWRTFSKICTD